MSNFFVNKLNSKEYYLDPIAKYIKTNYSNFSDIGIVDVAITTNLSKSTIVKWCKKIGFEGFKEMKNYIVNDLHMFSSETIPLQDKIEKYIDFTNIQSDRLSNFAKSLVEAKQILIIGFGGSKALAEMLKYRLSKFGILSSHITNMYDFTTVSSKDTTWIVISTSLTNVLEEYGKYLFKNGNSNIFAITATLDYVHLGFDEKNVLSTGIVEDENEIEIEQYVAVEFIIYQISKHIAKIKGLETYTKSFLKLLEE